MFICAENLNFKETMNSMDPNAFLLDLSVKDVISYFLRLSMDRKTKTIIQVLVCFDENSNYYIESFDPFMDLSEEIEREKEQGYASFYSFIKNDAAVRMNLLFVKGGETI
ncbi:MULTISPECIES: hypothetical protein [Bacillus cereus group]|uniref:hypothetical protein n=1 Tax=Bacillus cereus group TaxID=86661 RepID=UPI00101420F1|nr:MULTISPECIES: hypothetical protein [Bacillus cereus group]MCU5201665.1 hypothetical protein [Bacillus paranthracis]MCU5374693.1 hypothetical protein [Bacillus pacificus]GCF76319.1 hypothetical protein BC2926_38600 [Bacillus cereus]